MPPRKRRGSFQDSAPIMTSAPLSPKNMKVVELREALEAKGMSPKGLKQELIDRLERCLQENDVPVETSKLSEELSEVEEMQNEATEEKPEQESPTTPEAIHTTRMQDDSKREDRSVVKVENFVRPFTLPALKDLFHSFGKINEFWMDSKRTICFVDFSNAAMASHCISKIDGLKWPTDNGKCLRASISTIDEMKGSKEAEEEGSRLVSNERNKKSAVEGSDLDSIFRKTVTEPQLYYLPARAN